MNTKIKEANRAAVLKSGLAALNHAQGLINYPIAEKISNAKLGTMHTIAYKSISNDVPGLVVYKKIRLRLTEYEKQAHVIERRAQGIKPVPKVDNRIHYKNNLAYNVKTGKYTFSFVPYEKLQEKFVLNGWEVSPERAKALIERARIEKGKKEYKNDEWRTIELKNIIAFK